MKKRRRWLSILSGIVVLLAALYLIFAVIAEPAPSHAYFETLPSGALVIAHQGGDGLWPGDTMFAFERAVEMGVDVLEMDMHGTADGALVLMHDETVDRTTDGSGLVTDFTLEEIKNLDAGYDWTPDDGLTFPYRGQGITVASVDELFTAFPEIKMVIEIKQSEPSITGSFCDKLREYDMVEMVLVASFSDDVLEEFRETCPEAATSAGRVEVTTFYVLNRLFLSRLYSPKAHAFQVPERNSGLTVLTERFVSNAHSRNLDVHAWTINEQSDMRRFLDMGVDGIITDYPDRLLEVLQR